MSTEQHGFKAEVQQLLDLMIHSIYSDREIFLRELVSNAADALDKARFMDVTRSDLTAAGNEVPGIRVTVDNDAKSITIEDDGIGMTEAEVVEYLGTIAHSGSKQFLDKLKQSKSENSPDLIGQFGIGFYSTFMVARQVDVESLSALPDSAPVKWSSEGAGTYTIEPGERTQRGTRITLHMRSDSDEFVDDSRLQGIVRRYSNFLAWPVFVGEDKANDGKAVWTKNPQDVTEEEANAFYKSISTDWNDPALTIHVKADTPIQYSAMIFVPKDRPWNLFHPNQERGPRLYARRVMISEHAQEIFPEWLRFLVGAIDSEDIALNVSRELVQKTPTIRKISDLMVKRVLKEFSKLLKSKGDDETKAANRDKYETIWRAFGMLLKEGYYHSGPELKERILPLILANTTSHEDGDGLMSLAEYKQAMPEEQDTIWYITGSDRAGALQSPSLEAFRKKGWDVLVLTDPVDEWMITSLTEFDGVEVKSVTRGELDIEDEEDSEEPQANLEGLLPWMEGVLEGQVASVRKSTRLTESAAVLVDADDGISSNLERILKQANQDSPMPTKRVLEINSKHPLIRNLATLQETGQHDVAQPLAELLLDEARLIDGSLEHAAAMGRRVQSLLERVAAQAVASATP